MKRTYHRSRRVRKWISDFLATKEDGTASFTEIKEYLNNNYPKLAPTSQQLGNYLSKDPEWEKIEEPYFARPLTGGGILPTQNAWRVSRYRLTGAKREMTSVGQGSKIDWESEGVRTAHPTDEYLG